MLGGIMAASELRSAAPTCPILGRSVVLLRSAVRAQGMDWSPTCATAWDPSELCWKMGLDAFGDCRSPIRRNSSTNVIARKSQLEQTPGSSQNVTELGKPF